MIISAICKGYAYAPPATDTTLNDSDTCFHRMVHTLLDAWLPERLTFCGEPLKKLDIGD